MDGLNILGLNQYGEKRMFNFNQLFPAVYLINLPEHTERLEHAKKQLAKIGISDYIIFEGIKVNNGQTLQDREAGCKLSHLAIIEQCKKNSIDRVCIFEDDINIKDTFLEKLGMVKDFILNGDWHLFYFGGNLNVNSGHHYDIYNKDIMRVYRCYTTHAYCVNSSIYNQILQFKEVNTQYDVLLSFLIQEQYKKSFCMNPRQITQRTGFSYIMQKSLDYSIVLEDRKI